MTFQPPRRARPRAYQPLLARPDKLSHRVHHVRCLVEPRDGTHEETAVPFMKAPWDDPIRSRNAGQDE